MCWGCVEAWARACYDKSRIRGKLPGGGEGLEIRCFVGFGGLVKDVRPEAEQEEVVSEDDENDGDDEGEVGEPERKGRRTEGVVTATARGRRERKETEKRRATRESTEGKQKKQRDAKMAGQKSQEMKETHEPMERSKKGTVTQHTQAKAQMFTRASTQRTRRPRRLTGWLDGVVAPP